MNTRSPVLFMVFNRPDTTQRVFESIRAARPARLYVAADGPRTARNREAQRCEATRRIATAVDWPCELVTLFRTENLGCKRAVSSAITWFFEHEPEGIVLEDDCLPDASFFPYCDALLERYRDDPRVMCISGDNFVSDIWEPADSYYFSIYTHIWGWASWRRAWDVYDVDLHDWKASDPRLLLERKLPAERQAQLHWKMIFDRVAAGEIDTWDYQWNYACWKHDGLICLPKVNLVSNIGFGAEATHTVSVESKHANLGVAAMTLPLQHPNDVVASAYADRWTSEHVFGLDEHRHAVRHWRRALVLGLRKIWSHATARAKLNDSTRQR